MYYSIMQSSFVGGMQLSIVFLLAVAWVVAGTSPSRNDVGSQGQISRRELDDTEGHKVLVKV